MRYSIITVTLVLASPQALVREDVGDQGREPGSQDGVGGARAAVVHRRSAAGKDQVVV